MRWGHDGAAEIRSVWDPGPGMCEVVHRLRRYPLLRCSLFNRLGKRQPKPMASSLLQMGPASMSMAKAPLLEDDGPG
jgi:hypothetical protein